MVRSVHPLEEIVDHAPLFPPASLSVPDALAEEARVRASDQAWLVGRFVARASHLRELGDVPLRLTVVLDGADVALDDPRVEAVEVPPAVAADVDVQVEEVYVERPVAGLAWLDEVAALGRRAKVRCGGESVPSVPELAAFVRRCRELGVPFKATAGLHHPVAAPGRHGFLNLLSAATFGDEEHALADDDPAAFALGEGRFAWRGHEADAAEIARVRREVFVSFGSCSIAEPVEDLEALGLL
jgi:hypothetical protein